MNKPAAFSKVLRCGSGRSALSSPRFAFSSGPTAADKYSKPIITDDGVIVYQADPSTASSGPGLTWGSVLWPSGACLARFLAWNYRQQKTDRLPKMMNGNTRVLELGCGTGVVGLTCAKLGVRRATLSDSEPALWPILRKSICANNVSKNAEVHNLDWRDTTTFIQTQEVGSMHDLIVAADVLYAGMDGLFARVLASHLPSRDEIGGLRQPEGLLACPFRRDSPLLKFFSIAHRLGLELDRLEDSAGNAAGGAPGTSASEVFAESEFVRLGSGNDNANQRWQSVANDPTFSECNKDCIQIFRVRRTHGSSADARSIRRVGRL